MPNKHVTRVTIDLPRHTVFYFWACFTYFCLQYEVDDTYKSCGLIENVPGQGNVQYRSNLISTFLFGGLLSSQMATVRRDHCQLSDQNLNDTDNGCFFLKTQKATLNLWSII